MSVFITIANLARTAESGYPEAVKNLARAAAMLHAVRDMPLHLPNAQHGYDEHLGVRGDFRKMLVEVGSLVFLHLPVEAAKLRIISDVTGTVQFEPDVDALIAELRTIRAAAIQAEAAGDITPAEPKVYLVNWKEVLATLKLTADKKDWIVKANERYEGPIVLAGRGGQPFCDQRELLVWHAGLAARISELHQRRRDKQATVAVRHNYGETGTVVVEIAGSVKKRRKDARP